MALLWWFVPVLVVIAWPWTLCGGLMIAVGMGITVVADQQFKRHETTVKPFQKSSTLVTDGVFRLSRHPMYLGMVVVLLGIAIAFGVLMPFAVPIGFAVLLRFAFVTHEERDLTGQFGHEYKEYKARVRPWL